MSKIPQKQLNRLYLSVYLSKLFLYLLSLCDVFFLFYRLESEWRCVTILVGTSKEIKHFSFQESDLINNSHCVAAIVGTLDRNLLLR